MSTRKSSKRKKGVTIHKIAEDPGPSRGYIETHTEYSRQGGALTSMTTTVNIPPSPTKPGAERTARVASPLPALGIPGQVAALEQRAHPAEPCDSVWQANESAQSGDETDGDEGPRKKRKRIPTDPLAQFTEHIDTMIDELLRLEGLGTNTPMARLFPATLTDPRTAASFRVLETFQMLSFTAKTSAYEFLGALRRRTDNTEQEEVPDRYWEFMRMIHEWRHLRLLKRMGRGHDPSGVRGTGQGDCVVLCPACPLPDVNMPEDWRTSEDPWVHALFLAMDANFRLTRRNVSSDQKDPGLNHGYAYMVDETQFKEYLALFGELIPDDKSTCNNHDAIKLASIRGGRGFAASGLGTVQCSRHDMKRPGGSGDLQKGERYVNMDYFCLSTLRHNIPMMLVISYDIICQWSVNFVARCLKYPPNAVGAANPALDIRYLIPKFHLPAHVQKCWDSFSFNLTPHVGRTDGEAPERGWASSNDLAYSTREMGPGSRRDTLDDCFGDMNWSKAARMAATLAARAKDAILWRQEQVEAFLSFARTLPADLCRSWTTRVRQWEKGDSTKNPFEYENEEVTISAVRYELAREEEDNIKAGRVSVVHKEVTTSEFILQGLNLEDGIRRHLTEEKSLRPSATNLKKSSSLEEANHLRRRFLSWEELQRLYMPTVMPHRQSHGDEGKAASADLRDIRLYLPSEAHVVLRDLRERLVVRQHMYSSKKRYSHGTEAITRSNRKIEVEGKRIAELASRCRSIREKLVVLSAVRGDDGWRDTLKVLDDKDIQGLTTEDDRLMAVGARDKKSRLGSGKKRLTWIWYVVGPRKDDNGGNGTVDDKEVGDVDDDEWEGTDSGAGDGDGDGYSDGSVDGEGVEEAPAVHSPENDPALRVEFCSTRARAHRWQEECVLLDEELSRVERFWAWEAKLWEDRVGVLSYSAETVANESAHGVEHAELVKRARNAASVLASGKRAYAERQARIRKKLHLDAVVRHEGVREGLRDMVIFGESRNPRTMVERWGRKRSRPHV
ncbi:hypothetical protein MD484_g7185, partial [Candolleomyces efflorescens]